MGDGEMVVGDGKVAFLCGRRISGVDLRLSSPDIVVATLRLANCLFCICIFIYLYYLYLRFSCHIGLFR